MRKQFSLLLLSIIFVIIFSCSGINADYSSGINIQDLIVTQLHETYEDLPHKYNLTLVATGSENITFNWTINCGYFVGEVKRNNVEWHYDTAGECVNAKVEVNATNATGAGQKLNQDVFNPGTRVIINIYPGNISQENESQQKTTTKNDSEKNLTENESIILITTDHAIRPRIGDIISVRYAWENKSVKISSLPTFPLDFESLDEIEIENDIPDPVIIGVKKISDSTIEFQNLAATVNLNYNWDFGDGTTSDKQNPTHDYKTGNYIVILKTTDSSGNASMQKLPVTIKKMGFFGKIWSGFLGIFRFGKEGIKEIKNDIGSVATLSSTAPVKIYNKGGYSWGSTNPDIAIVDSNGVVRFTENFTQGKLVGILGIRDNEQLITFIRHSENLGKSRQFVVIGDPLQNFKGNLNVIISNATKETFDTDLALAASDVSDEGNEAAKDLLEGSAKDILTELVKLKNEKWGKLYELTRKIWEGKKSFEKIPESACKCLELFQEFLGSQEQIDAKNNFWNYCFCVHTMADSAGVTLFGYYSCLGISDYAPDPVELKEQNFEAYKKMIESLEDSIKECREPGYLEKRAKECEEAKSNCKKAREMVEKAKNLVSETKQLIDEVKNASIEAELAHYDANDAFEKLANANTSEAIKLANKAIKAAQKAGEFAFYVEQKTQEAKNKKKEAKDLLNLALEFCPGKCAPVDNSTEIRNMINEEKAKLESFYGAGESFIVYITQSTMESARKASIMATSSIEFIKIIQITEKEKNCEKALSLARESLEFANGITDGINLLKEKSQNLADSAEKLNKLELKARNIRAKEIFYRSIKLKEVLQESSKELGYAEEYFGQIKLLQNDINFVAAHVKKIANSAQQMLLEGDNKNQNCIEAKKLIEQAIEKADKDVNSASSLVKSAQTNLNSAMKSRQNIAEIKKEWEDKRNAFKVYTYINDNGETVIWAGNGDAQPPPNSVYHGTMQNGKWVDGAPPPIN